MVDNSFFEYCSRENEKLLNEWDYSQNQNTPEEYSKCSGKKVFWKCENGHSWTARISDRIRGNGCPYCSGKRPVVGVNDLKTINPSLVKEWNYNRNVKLPSDFLPKSLSLIHI